MRDLPTGISPDPGVRRGAEIDLDLTRHDQRRVVSIMWSLAEKERMENLSDIVSAPRGVDGK